ncbi:MAG: hypothetical protein NVSMB67_12200 [Flavisolibacter sp.]
MKIYYILDGQIESGPFTLDAIKSKGINCRSFIRLQNSSYWIAVVELEELADYIILPAEENVANASKTHRIASRKILITSAFKIVVPFFICLVIGSMTIAMGIFLQGQVSAKNIGKWLNGPDLPDKSSLNTINCIPKTAIPNSKNNPATTTSEQANRIDSFFFNTYPFLSDPLAKQNFYRNYWSKYMTLTSSKYKVRFLGGVKGLSITFATIQTILWIV